MKGVIKQLIKVTSSIPLLLVVTANLWPRRWGHHEDLGPFQTEWEGVPQTAFGWPVAYFRWLDHPLKDGSHFKWDIGAIVADGVLLLICAGFAAFVWLFVNLLMRSRRSSAS